MRIRWLIALLATVGLCGSVGAQPAEPTIEVRLQSVNVLLDKGEYLAGLAGKEDVVQGVKFIVKNFQMGGKGIEGIDPKRPFGAYVTLQAEVIGSPVTAMVPIVDQDKFLAMLKERLDITPEKVEGGALKVELPEAFMNPVVGAIYLRFANDYLYVGRSAKDLDPKGLIDPKKFFVKDDAALVSVLVRGDRIPEEVKTFLTGQVELFTAEQRKKNGPNEDPAKKAILDFAGDGLAGGLKTLLSDSKELSVRLVVDEKADESSVDVVLAPKPNTTLAKYIASLDGKTSLSAGIVAVKDPVARGSVKIAMPPDMHAGFGKAIDEIIASATKKAGDNEKEAIGRVLKTLAPTVKAGELDVAASLSGPDAKGRYTLLAALAVKDGKKIEQLAKDFAAFAGGEAEFTFDVEKIGDFNLHKVVLTRVPPEFEKVFGTKTVWVAISDTHIAASVDADGAALRAGLKAQAIKVPAFVAEVSLAKVLPLAAQELKPDEVKAILKDAFGDGGSSGKDTAMVTITGGDKLTARASVKGKGIRVIFAANLIKMN